MNNCTNSLKIDAATCLVFEHSGCTLGCWMNCWYAASLELQKRTCCDYILQIIPVKYIGVFEKLQLSSEVDSCIAGICCGSVLNSCYFPAAGDSKDCCFSSAHRLKEHEI